MKQLEIVFQKVEMQAHAKGPDREWGWMVTGNGMITVVDDARHGATAAGSGRDRRTEKEASTTVLQDHGRGAYQVPQHSQQQRLFSWSNTTNLSLIRSF